MKKFKYIFSLLFFFQLILAHAQSNLKPEDTEYYDPKPRVVTLNKQQIPDDAIILFDGTDLDQWVSRKNPDQAAAWEIQNGQLIVKPKTGDIQTKEIFDNLQLHIEWKSPEDIKGSGQGRGNSGIFLQGMYEIQILDNNNNPTYVNGQAGSLYKQRPPLVEVKQNSDGWHSYDIIYTAPVFNHDGQLVRKGNITVLHNGVLIQNHTVIEGTTEYIGLPKIIPHGKGPIILQDHGDQVRFRNIWIRKL